MNKTEPDQEFVNDFFSRETTRAGFDKFAITSVVDLNGTQYSEQYTRSISQGNNASMSYLKRDINQRFDVRYLLKEAKTVVCLAVSYVEENISPRTSDHVWVARYAKRVDYHKALSSKLEKLVSVIKKRFPNANCVTCVDDKPIAEKAFAEQSGLGFIGKNTLLITPEFGSWVVLGEIILDISIKEMESALRENSTLGFRSGSDSETVDHQSHNLSGCGACTKCLDVCPTSAIVEPYMLDSRKCISYLNKDAKEEVSSELTDKMGNWIFGCDICQEVCPMNKQVLSTQLGTLQVLLNEEVLKTSELVNIVHGTISNPENLARCFSKIFNGTPVLEMGVRRFINNLNRISAL